jgi:lipid-binding SYLF domain-containing protein
LPRLTPRNSLAVTTARAFLSAALLLIVLGASSAHGDDKQSDEETLRNAATVLRAMLDGGSVPEDLLAKAACVLVLPGVKKFGFGIGGSGGRGPMSCRLGENFRGSWSAPAIYGIGGVSLGFQVGGSSSDFVVLVMHRSAVDALIKGKTKLGRDATAAAGPTGATTVSTSSDLFTYGRAKGLFAGVSMGSATLSPDDDANQRLYGKAVTTREILVSNTVQMPLAGRPLVSTLRTAIADR